MRALILANGVLPPHEIVNALAKRADLLICADGGANHARRLGLKPDIIIGDLDSISRHSRNRFSKVPIVAVTDQESTDLEKALRYCVSRRIRSVDIIGTLGDRIDHATGSLGCFKKFGDLVEMQMYDRNGWVVLVPGSIRLKMEIGEKLSLIPLDRCSGVMTHNLKYSLKKSRLQLGVREGISNEAVGQEVHIRVEKGTLLLYRFFGKERHRRRAGSSSAKLFPLP